MPAVRGLGKGVGMGAAMGAATGGERVLQSVLRAVAATPAGEQGAQREGRPAAGPADSVASGDGRPLGWIQPWCQAKRTSRKSPRGVPPSSAGPKPTAAGGFALCRIAPPPDHEDAGGKMGVTRMISRNGARA